jgi:arginase
VLDGVRGVAAAVEEVRRGGAVALVLGGDCTLELGTVAGVLAAGERPALVYLDPHPDLNVPSSVPDGALDWMGMAHLLDVEGALPELAGAGPRRPLLAPADVLLLGQAPRHSTPWEHAQLERLGLRRITLEEVAADPAAAGRRAGEWAAARGGALLVHLDVDAVDFVDAPLSENTGRNTLLPLSAVLSALGALLAGPPLAALTLTELNPLHGAQDGSTLARLVDGLVAALAPALLR